MQLDIRSVLALMFLTLVEAINTYIWHYYCHKCIQFIQYIGSMAGLLSLIMNSTTIIIHKVML